ncbi:MAG: hypothetical protein V3W41_21395 [Planctomycetota bacterium]
MTLEADSNLKQILRLLNSGDHELRSAAALVLGRLRPVSPATLDALQVHLSSAARSEASYFIDALGASNDPSILPSILGFLEEPGSLAEQVVNVLREFALDALPAIRDRHRDEKGWRSGGYIKALAGIPHHESLAMLFDRLADCTWEQARAMSVCLLENLPKMPEELRNYACERVGAELTRQRTLGSEACEHVVITSLRLLECVPSASTLEGALFFTTPEQAAGVRKHALKALCFLSLSREEVSRLREQVLPYLQESGVDSIIRPSLSALAAHDNTGLDADCLRELLKSEHFLVAEFALGALAQQLGAGAIPDLEEHLYSRHSRLRQLSIWRLSDLPEGADILMEAMGQRRSRYLPSEIAELANLSRDTLTAARFEAVLGAYVESQAKEPDRGESPPLVFLARHDPEQLNESLSALAIQYLRERNFSFVIALLQPLVRLRLSDHENRLNLALANLAAAESNFALENSHFRRCIDILAPLARTTGYTLASHLESSGALSSQSRFALVHHLTGKGPAERREAQILASRLELETLSPQQRDGIERLLDPNSET